MGNVLFRAFLLELYLGREIEKRQNLAKKGGSLDKRQKIYYQCREKNLIFYKVLHLY